MNEKKRSGLASIFFVAMMLGVFFCVMFPSGQTPKQKWQGEVTAIYKLLGPSLYEIPAAMSSDIYKSGYRFITDSFNFRVPNSEKAPFRKWGGKLGHGWYELQYYILTVLFRLTAAAYWFVLLLPALFVSILFAGLERRFAKETFLYTSPWKLKLSSTFLRFLLLAAFLLIFLPFSLPPEGLLVTIGLLCAFAGLPIFNLQKNI